MDYKCLNDYYENNERLLTKNRTYNITSIAELYQTLYTVVDNLGNKMLFKSDFLDKYFKKIEKPKTYFGDEILKMVREGKLKDEYILIKQIYRYDGELQSTIKYTVSEILNTPTSVIGFVNSKFVISEE